VESKQSIFRALAHRRISRYPQSPAPTPIYGVSSPPLPRRPPPRPRVRAGHPPLAPLPFRRHCCPHVRLTARLALSFQGRRRGGGGGCRFVDRGGRPRLALPRRPRTTLPRTHLLPRRLHQARAASPTAPSPSASAAPWAPGNSGYFRHTVIGLPGPSRLMQLALSHPFEKFRGALIR
jgi:hypothetical protein